MNTNDILYYPYINIPNSIWTTRALLYWDSVGAIVPEEYIHNPERLDAFMHDLVKASLVKQIIPIEFTRDLPDFKKCFLDIVLDSKFLINKKRKLFQQGKHFRIHVEKFDVGIMNALNELELARRDEWPWWCVEEETARMLMVYLASAISIVDNRTPVTDQVSVIGNHRTFSRPEEDEKRKVYSSIRSRLLNDIMPLPSEISVSKLVKFKEKNSQELRRFRNKVEQLTVGLSALENPLDFERKYKLDIDEINDSKEFICSKLKESKFGKIFFGTICSLSATGISVAQTPKELMYWTAPSIINAVWNVVDSHRKSEINRREPFSYLALIENSFKVPV
ncbi:hypothetical protein [Hymenobacter volaticus]|uniref:Uncharacterized protein n=1 Tax=Hymenobacter volaticus TaxID=2932254 RepID=A0ABY4G495_9BACT|nr:hypothetical protein [Hymenobacter volaticus]UOQ65714.1 hypothetical protein MUN86_19625 [Hymenobacter volaticus]